MNIPEAVLTQAAALFDVERALLHLLGGMDGLAYEANQAGKPCVLKVAPVPVDQIDHPGKMQEKFEFVSYLAEKGVRVAKPLLSLNGRWVEWIEAAEGNYVASAAEKAPGHHPGSRKTQDLTPRLFQEWGRVTGQMHHLAREYKTWRRDPSDSPTLIMDWRMEHQSFFDWCKEEEIRAKWVQLGQRMEKLPQSRAAYGLCHNDLHTANFLVNRGRITVIDFDVCTYHWFSVDLAIPLFFADWGGPPDKRQPKREFLQGFFDDFMNGYARENTLDPFWVQQTPLFLKHHQILLYIVFSDQWKENPNPWQTGILQKWRSSILNDTPVVDIVF